jgi:hypothetical protein
VLAGAGCSHGVPDVPNGVFRELIAAANPQC